MDAAIYLPGAQDPYMHASMSCDHRSMKTSSTFVSTATITERYRVSSVMYAIDKGKKPCPDCWTVGGYRAEDDILAGL